MYSPDRLEFGPFCLDLIAARLSCGNEIVPLRRKTFRVLRYLIERPNELVTPEELRQHIWNGVHVSRGVLRVNIREIRVALGDSVQAPQYLETVRGQGYRFIGKLSKRLEDGTLCKALPEPENHLTQHVVGYDHELAQLQLAWAQARRGQRQVVMISGEAGMGKTTLVDVFLTRVAGTTGLRLAQGQCIESHGKDDAYLPLLSALERLACDIGGDTVASVLRQVTPSWLLYLPMLVPEAERDTLFSQMQNTTQAQMLLELSKALETLASSSPLVLVLEDLHWSDACTVAAIAYLTNRDEPANLLIVGTYRSVEIQLQAHPLLGFLQEAEAHHRVIGVSLTGLTETDIARYWLNRLHAPCLPETIEFLEVRSRGNAMFLVNLVDQLIREELVVHHGEGWGLRDPLSAWYLLPQKVKYLLTKQLDQLPPALQHILEVASVVGDTFAAVAVSAGTEIELKTIERLCTAVVRLGGFLEATGLCLWPDGTVSGQYRFKHDLVRKVAYERADEGRRAEWHRRIGLRLELGYGERSPEIALILATHFMHGRDTSRAAYYLQITPDQVLTSDSLQVPLTSCHVASGCSPALLTSSAYVQLEFSGST